MSAVTIKTPCGCSITCDWPSGDRRIRCDHGRFWIFRKLRPRNIHGEEYVLDKETFPE